MQLFEFFLKLERPRKALVNSFLAALKEAFRVGLLAGFVHCSCFYVIGYGILIHPEIGAMIPVEFTAVRGETLANFHIPHSSICVRGVTYPKENNFHTRPTSMRVGSVVPGLAVDSNFCCMLFAYKH